MPSQQQGDDQRTGAHADEQPRRLTTTGSPQAFRTPVADTGAPKSGHAHTTNSKRHRATPQPGTDALLALPSGPPILGPLAARHGQAPPSIFTTARSLAANTGFGPLPPTRRLAEIWRPAAVFAGVCAALALCAFGLVGRHIGHAVVTRQAALTLTVVLLLDVLLMLGLLALATRDTGRTLALSAGGVCALVGAAFILGGGPVGMAMSVICLMIVGLGARQSIHGVPEGAVHITARPGGRHRTLLPGLNLLLPGERLLATLSTIPRTHQSLPERAALPNGMEAEAAVAVNYALQAEHADRAVATTRDWERVLRGRVRIVLREELADFLADSVPPDTAVDERALTPMATTASDSGATTSAAIDELRARIQTRLRHDASVQGIEILSVEVRDVIMPSSVLMFWNNAPSAAREERRKEIVRPPDTRTAPNRAEEQPIATLAAPIVPVLASVGAGATTRDTPFGAAPGAVAQAYVSAFQERLGGLVRGWRTLIGHRQTSDEESGVAAPEYAQPTPKAPISLTGDRHVGSAVETPRAARALSARTLAAMYEAVEEERITDPETVRHVAEALGQYVPSHDEEDVLPFDAQVAATDLLRHLAEQAQPANYEPPGPAEQAGGSASVESGHTMRSDSQRPPSDDNILRGG